jgi:hypothetical protein
LDGKGVEGIRALIWGGREPFDEGEDLFAVVEGRRGITRAGKPRVGIVRPRTAQSRHVRTVVTICPPPALFEAVSVPSVGGSTAEEFVTLFRSQRGRTRLHWKAAAVRLQYFAEYSWRWVRLTAFRATAPEFREPADGQIPAF